MTAVFGNMVTWYLFLGGAAAGGGLLLAVLALLVPADLRSRFLSRTLDEGRRKLYSRFFGTTHVAVLVALAMAVLCLVLELGRPGQMLQLFITPTLSFMTLGSYALSAALLLAVAQCALWSGLVQLSEGAFVAMQGTAAFVNGIVALYTGLLLSSLPSVPLWSSVWLPMLFVLSALSCGLALVLSAAQFSGSGRMFGTVTARLLQVDAGLIVLEAVAAFALLAATYETSKTGSGGADVVAQAARLSLDELLRGGCDQAFWGGFVLLGLSVPFVCDILLSRGIAASTDKTISFSRSTHVLIVAFCVLIGGFALRWCIVAAGVPPATLLGAWGV